MLPKKAHQKGILESGTEDSGFKDGSWGEIALPQTVLLARPSSELPNEGTQSNMLHFLRTLFPN